MTKTGPQRYPGASTAYWHQAKWGGTAMESNVVVWHTTEGTAVPSYDGGAQAPNFTAAPDFTAKKLRWYQHFDFDVSSRALVNKAGGVQTNTLNAVQIELVGTCDSNTHTRWGSKPHLYSADLPDWAIRDLADFAKWAHNNHGVPLTGRTEWLAYGKDPRRPGITPASYGASPARMTYTEWNSFTGHCGHQHVPENDHGDPGAFPMAAILITAKGDTTPEPPQEDDRMPTTLGLYDDTDRTLTPGKWTTLTVEKVDLLAGATAYTASTYMTVNAPAGSTLQGRFYHYRTNGTRWTGPVIERITTDGSSFVDFAHSGSINTAEKLRFEVCYLPADTTDKQSITVTTSRVRGLYWK